MKCELNRNVKADNSTASQKQLLNENVVKMLLS